MVSFKGILKYLIYIFLAGWMFLLGIMVGRGTSPVKFDTQRFQDRLEAIAREHGSSEDKEPQKVDLEYYNALNHPIPTEGNPDSKKSKEIIPKKEILAVIPESAGSVKTSLKKATFNASVNIKQTGKAKEKSTIRQNSPVKTKLAKKTIAKKEDHAEPAVKTKAASKEVKKAVKTVESKGIYTIQIAAYKDIKDAKTQIVQLEKKGFSAYQVKSTIKGKTWYRVRSGSFSAYDQAKAYNEKFKKARIKSLIIKK